MVLVFRLAVHSLSSSSPVHTCGTSSVHTSLLFTSSSLFSPLPLSCVLLFTLRVQFFVAGSTRGTIFAAPFTSGTFRSSSQCGTPLFTFLHLLALVSRALLASALVYLFCSVLVSPALSCSLLLFCSLFSSAQPLANTQWVASTTCKTQVCKSAPALFDASLSDDSGVPQSLAYHSGSVTGDIYWEQVTLGNFGIGYQAMGESSFQLQATCLLDALATAPQPAYPHWPKP